MAGDEGTAARSDANGQRKSERHGGAVAIHPGIQCHSASGKNNSSSRGRRKRRRNTVNDDAVVLEPEGPCTAPRDVVSMNPGTRVEIKPET